MSKENFAETLNPLLEPMGIKIRTILIDYCDKNGNYYNTDAYPVGTCSDSTVVSNFINAEKFQDYKICAIHELLDGYTAEKIAELTNRNPQEAIKHIKVLYLDQSTGW